MKNNINLTKTLYKDLILENNLEKIDTKTTYKNIEITNTIYNNYKYTTIYFNDINDKKTFNNLEETLIKELESYLNIKQNDKILIIGLGNRNITPDSLGPKTLDNIIVTSYLFNLGIPEKGYINTSKFTPSVTGDTGIDTVKLIKTLIKELEPTKVIVIDSLKASKTERLLKTIQITNSGIHPGSGINNNRGEISKETTNKEIISIGIPTVVDVKTILENILKEKVELKENLIVTPTNIDYLIEKLTILLANSINKTLHTSIRQNN